MGRSGTRRAAGTGTAERARLELAARLSERRGEIEQAALTRVYAIQDPSEADPVYLLGLREAVSAALTYGLEAIERGEGRSPAVPVALLAQARIAARHRVSLDTVLRRYFAGYTLLGDFLFQEAEEAGLGRDSLKRLLRVQANLFDRLLAAVTEEYERERRATPSTYERSRAQQVERLLAGELLDPSGLAYDFEGFHLGLLACGPGAEEAIRELSGRLDCRSLTLSRPEEALWAWLGSRRRLDPQELTPGSLPPNLAMAIGEPGEGLSGWRLTHRQAKAALPVALRGPEPLARYAEVALLATAIQDEVLITSLRQLYLEPLECGRDKGEMAKQTLRAYFAAGRHVSSAALALGVKRHTVSKRLRLAEAELPRTLDALTADIEVALAFDELR